MKPNDGQMLRVRLECLKLAVAMAPTGIYRRPDMVEDVANAFLRYVLTGLFSEQARAAQEHKPVEMTDAEVADFYGGKGERIAPP